MHKKRKKRNSISVNRNNTTKTQHKIILIFQLEHIELTLIKVTISLFYLSLHQKMRINRKDILA